MKHIYSKVLTVVYILFFCGHLASAQSGPAGIGNSDGSNGHPHNVLWLKAAALTGLSNNDQLSTWSDLSGNGHDFIQTNGVNQPLYNNTTGINGNAVISFDGSGDHLTDDDMDSYFDGLSGLTTFAIIRSNQINTDRGFFDTRSPNGSDDQFAIRYDSGGASGGGDDVVKIGLRAGNSSQIETSSNVQSTSAQLITVWWNSGDQISIGFDGVTNALSYGGNPITGTISGTAAGYVGKGPKDASAGWDGDIAELIVYGDKLNAAQRIVVENYLAETYNLTIANDAYTNPNYIGDLTGMGQASGETLPLSQSAGFYVQDNGGLSDGDFIFFAHNNVVNDGPTTIDMPSGIAQAWKRDWYVQKTGNFDAKIIFDLPEGIGGQNPGDLVNYKLLYRSGTSGDYSIVTASVVAADSDQIAFDVADANIADGYYTLGTTNSTASPVEGIPGLTWYTLASGNWTDSDIWTLDPSGSLPNNPASAYPNLLTDNIVVKTGKTVTMDVNNLTCDKLTVEGRLDMAQASGHSFSVINGNGRILMAADNFPAGDASHFVTKGQGEGTVEYYGGIISISSGLTFYDVEISLDDKANSLTFINDLNINGNLFVEQGILQINDGDNLNPLNITVDGNISVKADGGISVGTADAYNSSAQSGYGNYHKGFHVLTVGGDISNYGNIRLTNQTVPDYNSRAMNGAASLVFTGARNTRFDCYNTTNLYMMVVDKGVDRTYELITYADNKAYFTLFGDNDEGWNTGVIDNPEMRKALWVKAGTLTFSGAVYVSSLTEGGRDYTIGYPAAIKVDGPNVYVSVTANENSDYSNLSFAPGTPDGVRTSSGNTGLYLFGKLLVNNGTLYQGEGEAINFRDEAPGAIEVNGGVLSVNQIGISSSASRGDFSYKQTGGLVEIRGDYGPDGDNAMLNLNTSDMSFTMSGGELRVLRTTSNNPNGIHISSAPANTNVTGGLVKVLANGNTNFQINTTVPFYNFEVERANASADVTIDLQTELTILNDLTINANTFLDHNGFDVSIGRNFSIDANATEVSNNKGYLYDASATNTTTFNGSEDGVFYIGHPFDDGWELYLHNLVIDKPADKTLLIQSDTEKEAANVSNDFYARLIQVKNNTQVIGGTLDQGAQSLRLYGPIEISSIGKLGVYEHGTTHIDALIMFKDADVSIITENGAELGNIKMNPAPKTDIITLTSDVKIGRISYYHGRINLGSHRLTLDYFHQQSTTNNYSINKGNAAQEMFYTDGNASDGGLSLYVDSSIADGTVLGFPVGVLGKYTPVEVTVSNVTSAGYINVNPVNKAQPSLVGGTSNALQYYWNIQPLDFTAVPDVTMDMVYEDVDIDGNENNYVAGRLVNFSTWENTVGTINTNNNKIKYSSGVLTEGDYTAAQNSRINGSVRVLYARKNGEWHDYTTWSTTADGANPLNNKNQLPAAGDICVVGSTSSNYAVAISETHDDYEAINIARLCILRYASGESSTVTIGQNGSDCNFGVVSNLDPDIVDPYLTETHGSKIIVSGPDLPLGDFGQFMNAPNTLWTYSRAFPGTNSAIDDADGGNLSNVYYDGYEIGTSITEYPVLQFEYSGRTSGAIQYITLPAIDITVHNDIRFFKNINHIKLNSALNADVVVEDDLVFSNGGVTVEFQAAGANKSLTVNGNIDYNSSSNTSIIVEEQNSTSAKHIIKLGGDIINVSASSSIEGFYSESKSYLDIEFNGNGNSIWEEFVDVPSINQLIINKTDGLAESVELLSEVTLGSLANSGSELKPIQLKSGLLILNKDNTNWVLSNGGDNFSIPSIAALEVTQGTASCLGNSGISLDGALYVSGGTVDMSGGDNFIEYSASGNACIEVSSGALTVGSQIRRGLATDDGILNYIQTGGDVIVGQYSAPEGTRGVLEVLGVGSNFEHSGGLLQIANGQANASVASLYLEPENYSIGSGTTITFDPVQTSGVNGISVYSSIPLKNVLLKDDVNLSVNLLTVPLTIEENFEIESNASFAANGLDLNIGGNFSNAGNFAHNNNTTTLIGNAAQQIIGNTVFYNLTKTENSDLVLQTGTTELTVDNIFDFQAGTIYDNENTISIKGYVNFAGTHEYSGIGKGLYLTGSLNQELSGGGVIGMLTIFNPEGVDIPIGNAFTINDKLRLETGIFNIDKNLLLLSETCIIEHGLEDFSSNNMIQNNISFTDNGVKKIFPKVTFGVDPSYSFVYPMGSGGKYTPVSVVMTNNGTNTGSLTVKPANEYHPSVDDPNNVLHYHWELKSDEISDFTATVKMKFVLEDAHVDGANLVTDYITARLLSDGTGDWNKFSGSGVIDESSNELVFDFAGTDDAGISGAYTAGINEAIPDQVPSYITIMDGDWTNENIWDSYPVSGGTVPAGGPRGSIVYVAHDVDVPNNFLSVYRTNVQAAGILNIGSTFGHRVGDVSGTGRIKLEDQGSLPAGVYDDFFAETGGTIEFSGSTDYDFLSDINSLNHVILSGTGERRFPNLDLSVKGDLSIVGVEAINEHNRNISLKKNFYFNGGAFDSGDNGAKIIFNGTTLQLIDGTSSFIGTNGIDYLEMNNPAGIELKVSVNVDSYLNLKNGIIYNINEDAFVVNSASASSVIGGGASSYVQGPLTKLVNNGESFSFPIGDADRLGDVLISNTITGSADYWTAEYFNNNPGNDSKDPNSVSGDIEFVSQNEYWRIQGPASGKAEVTLRWDNLSGVNPDANFRVVEWLSAFNWGEVDIATPNTTMQTVKTDLAAVFNEFAGEGNYFTFGSINIPAFTWKGTGTTGNWFDVTNWTGGIIPSAGTDITLNDDGLAPFIPNDVLVAQVNNLTINHTGGLTMNPGAQLTVNGNLTTNGLLFVENTNANPSSLITHGTVTGNVAMKWAYDNERWWFIGHAIANPTMAEYEKIRDEQSNDYAMYDLINDGSFYKVSSNVGTYDLSGQNELQGYLFKVRYAGAEVTQVGTLNNLATYQMPLQDDWQIMTNPYASYYKLPKQTISGADFEHTTGTVYVTVSTRNSDKTFETFNTISGLSSPETFANGILAPGQAFYIQTEPSHNGQMVYMRQGNRVHDVNKVSLKSQKTDVDVIRVKLNNGELTDEGVIALRENGDFAYSRIDSEQKFTTSSNYSFIYSVVDEKSLVINVLPQDVSNSSVTLGFKPKFAGVHTITIDGLSSLVDDYKLQLEDTEVGVIVDMDATTEYTFSANEQENNTRFILHFSKTEVATGIEDENEGASEEVNVFIQNKSSLHVNCDWLGEKHLMLYTLDGRLISNQTFDGASFKDELNLQPGVYIVKVLGDDKQYEQKVFVR
ncbi:T9SS type A sorting domain-containing protein [Carboxylicivirga sp. M1479]|uniref:T9SS type A sorting domain-containing protein n=1 Tax=Carboxylicivirga sp. M1479 TaxID=2594476 RepID=UPI00117762D2|nr:T9SS type A sorting domain-containing protein [Carboxylicivirga sp. M1479]TRX71812.1 T9SS type A sorting domain-containing protein [Carboxylicivirga sp. M1479]